MERAEALHVVPLVLQYWFDEFMEDDEPFWEKITVNVEEFRMMGDPAFRWHFRLTKPLFEILLQNIAHHLRERGRILRERRPMSHILLMVLWIIATPECFRAVALRFGVCPSEVHNAYVVIIEALREMADQYIKWPDENERNEIKRALQGPSDFPGIIGIMDCCNVPISAPVEDKASYRDYHQQYSIKMQAVCDNNLLVRDLYVGEAGSLHDARVFRRSTLCQNLLLMPHLVSPGEHIIADAAYMLLEKVMTHFENNGHLTVQQRNYNRRLSKVRCKIEHTFGHTQSLWRRLQFFPVVNLVYALDHIVSVIVLHNFRILHGDCVPVVPPAGHEYAEEEARVVGADVRAPQPGLNDHMEHPHAPQGFHARALAEAHMLGEQKRWDICNRLPPQ